VIKYARSVHPIPNTAALILHGFYWFRLTVVSLIWFIYDFLTYSFGIYSSAWLAIILGKSAPIWKSFGWNTIIYLFYLPGAVGGAFLSDIIGPRYALAIGVSLQGIVGFIMAGCYSATKLPTWLASSSFTASFFCWARQVRAIILDSLRLRRAPPPFEASTMP